MLDRQPTNKIVTLLNSTTKNFFQSRLKVELPLGIWHTLNHAILLVKHKRIQRYNPKLNMSNLKGILAFLITLYEFDSFSKILVAVGIPQASEVSQIALYRKVSQFYIIRWLPGMLTSRYIMSRDFIRSTPAKSAVVRYNLKYMKTTVYKLYNIPDLLILSSMNGMGSIIAKEAVIMKLPTIGLASNQSFPEKIAFRFFGDTRDLNFIRSFLCIIGLGMRIGGELGITNNFLNNHNFVEIISTKVCDISKEPNLRVNQIQYDFQLQIKSIIINVYFESLKLDFSHFFNLKLKKFKKFYKNLNLKKKKNNLSTIKLNPKLIYIYNKNTKTRVVRWYKEKKKKIKKKHKRNTRNIINFPLPVHIVY